MKEIQAKKLKIIDGKTFIVTVDIGKVTNMGYGRGPQGIEVKPFEFFNNGEGFKKFWDRISQAQAENHLETMVVGFESTGSYGEPLLNFLRKKPVRLVQVNPSHTKRLKELSGNSPSKTDRKDPRVIADIIELGHALTVVIPEGAAAELRRLTQARERSVQRRTALGNQLQSLVVILFPEFLQVMKNMKTRSARYLLGHFPAPQDIVNLGLETLILTLQRISRGRLKPQRAQELYAAAERSVGLEEGQRGMTLEIREILSQIEMADQFIEELEGEMSLYLRQILYSPLLLSLKGIGSVTAAGLIGEVGDFRKFHTRSEILKLAGLDLFEISSGKHKGKRHISKRGRPLLRKFLFWAAINTVRKGGVLRAPYQRLVQRGMPKVKALVAMARKLLGILFALVRDHRVYIKDYSKIQSLKVAA